MTINIPIDFCNYIELLAYETESRKKLLAFMKKINVDDDKYDELFKEYFQFYVQYEQAKRELEDNFLKPKLKNKNFSWTLHFNIGECEIEFNE